MFDPGYFDAQYFDIGGVPAPAGILGVGGYFDCAYFDQAYFDTGDCGDVTPSGGRGGRVITPLVLPTDDAEDLFALI